jgi:hypothetical protein
LALHRELVEKARGQTALAGAWYDFACAAALAGRSDEAFQYLRQAIGYGYNEAGHMAQDDDLKSLRNDARFATLVQGLNRKAPAAPKSK